MQRADAVTRFGRLVFLDDAADLVVAGFAQGLSIEGRRAGQEFVEQHSQGVDVAARVHIQPGELGLFGTHVERCADHLREFGEQRPLGELLIDRLGHAEVNHLGNGRHVVQFHQDVGGLEIAMDDALLVGVLHGPADRDEQLQPLA